ncbi:hypothetical protein [Haladaptatus paucihalophilus]|uniref:hypothetical protein n=1 Tax=Haladaptatus paucihalophilus TaxID=367189 RepID=UPI000B305537|nr:hypothetical protein [Haladaptatus paucihalophilus]
MTATTDVTETATAQHRTAPHRVLTALPSSCQRAPVSFVSISMSSTASALEQ